MCLFKTREKMTRTNKIRAMAKLFWLLRVITEKRKTWTHTWTAKHFLSQLIWYGSFFKGSEFSSTENFRPLGKCSVSDELRWKKVCGLCISEQKVIIIIHVELHLKSFFKVSGLSSSEVSRSEFSRTQNFRPLEKWSVSDELGWKSLVVHANR